MAEVLVHDLVRRFGPVVAVDHVSFKVADGEFVTLLGPSGCGKTTTLSALAGLDRPDGGTIKVGEEVFFDGASGRYVPAERRNLGLVFQSYALWPHMTVGENLAFPLQLRRVPKRRQGELIQEALGLVEMDRFVDRYPAQLSGGQQQRVALARTLVYQPKILLLDEPLSNLDAKLRERARLWLRHLQSQLGITTIYVTHDQIEALALSDRIAVMRDGQIAQLGTPKEIYERPADPFVADFIGTSNFLKGRTLDSVDGRVRVELEGGGELELAHRGAIPAGREITVAVRPERISLVSEGSPGVNRISARVTDRSYLGARWLYVLEASGQTLRLETERDLDGSELLLDLPPEHCAIFEAEPPAAPSAAPV